MEYISSLKNGITRTETAEMTLSHTSNIMSQTTIVNTCISYWILYPHYRESVVHISKIPSFRIFQSVCIGTVLPFLSAGFVSFLESRFLLWLSACNIQEKTPLPCIGSKIDTSNSQLPMDLIEYMSCEYYICHYICNSNVFHVYFY